MAVAAQLLGVKVSHGAPLWAVGAAIVLMLGALYFVFSAPGSRRVLRPWQRKQPAASPVAAAAPATAESVPAAGCEG